MGSPLRVELLDELRLLLNGMRRLHFPICQKRKRQSRLTPQCRWNHVALVGEHVHVVGAQVGQGAVDVLVGMEAGRHELCFTLGNGLKTMDSVS